MSNFFVGKKIYSEIIWPLVFSRQPFDSVHVKPHFNTQCPSPTQIYRPSAIPEVVHRNFCKEDAGTYLLLSSVSTGRDVPLSLCPGVPLSRDKGRSKFPGTKLFVPGRPGTKLIRIFFKKDHISCFRTSYSCFRTSFPCFRTSFSVLEHPFPVLEHLFLLCPVLSRVPSRSLAVPARPVPWQYF